MEAGFEADDDPKKEYPPMSSDTRAVVDRLDREVSGTHFRWKVFRQLFVLYDEREEHEARYALMNALAAFFTELRDMMIDTVFLDICRLTERPETIVRGSVEENVVIEQLIRAVEALDDPDFAELATYLNQCHYDVQAKCAPLRVHRNKRISHLDKAVLLSPSTEVLPTVTIQLIEDALEAIRHFVNEFRK